MNRCTQGMRIALFCWAVLALFAAACSEADGTASSLARPHDASSEPAVESGADSAGCGVLTCGSMAIECGIAPDGCGGIVSCGSCEGGQTCGGAGPNTCGANPCTPKTCSDLQASCGQLSDMCSNVLQCGSCVPPLECDAFHHCACLSSSCAATPPACKIEVAPTQGTEATSFHAGWSSSSDADTCNLVVDKGAPASCSCTGTRTIPGSDVGTGKHTIKLMPSNSAGAGLCSADFEVLGAPTCNIDVSPSTGDPNTAFVASWSSSPDAAECATSVDGSSPTAVPCSGSHTFQGSALGVGSHTVALGIKGPGGTGTCAAELTVELKPTCDVSVSPSSGSPATQFNVSWKASYATSCRYSRDGGAEQYVACSGSLNFQGAAAGVGNHSVKLVASNPYDSSECGDSFTVNAP
jgi:hypothetical protein